MPGELNARVGRTMPSPFLLLPAADSPGVIARARAIPRSAWLLGALLAALWPHWIYVARRMVDGSDEPWGALALATVVVLLAAERRLAEPTRAALVASAVLAVLAAIASLALPDLAAAAIAMLALGAYLVHALRDRPATPLIALLVLSLPIIASLQFYLGFPLRVLAAHASALLLSIGGLDAQAAGASIVADGRLVLVDAPCAGIGMLWVGSYVAALFSYLNHAGLLRATVNGAVAGALVLAANIARNALLFFPEAGLVDWPTWSHEAIGLSAFGAAVVPITLFTARKFG
jgi:exosortase/archaeosortase family protein